MERMATLEPMFVDVTWGAGGSTSDLTLAISANAQKYLGVEVLMHLTCTNLKVSSALNGEILLLWLLFFPLKPKLENRTVWPKGARECLDNCNR